MADTQEWWGSIELDNTYKPSVTVGGDLDLLRLRMYHQGIINVLFYSMVQKLLDDGLLPDYTKTTIRSI